MHSLPAAPPTYNDPNPLNIEIRTKFPVARIKRIMQADEEVGKVAQVTPVAVSKALELFMIALVGGAADKAREKGGKKVTAQHLKSVVLGSEQFDFLAEIVGRVAEVQEGAGGEGRKRKGKEEKDSESSEEEKKPKKGRGRKKKGDE
ncbi:putative DNA polymerase epsilon subunit C [Cadophora sp. MPI-SDFR-AT-0126]|nr:putative DNA polymerase epsilon subunit C [Leotiomycetes sp. MPI-SDFR-AT-0126]